MIFSSTSLAQGGPQGQLPAFEDPSFRDKLWEAGGPQFANTRSGKLILSVTIVGEQSVSENKILSHMQSRSDRIFDPEQLDRDIRELYNTELFSKIETHFLDTPEGIHIRLTVKENPTVRSIVFHGNTYLNDSHLKKHAGIVVGDPINPASAKQAEGRLIDLYRDKGYGNADVKLVSGGKLGERDLIFRISEGELERIWQIQFVGNREFSSSVLKTRIKSRDARKGLTAWIGNAADRSVIFEDQQALEQYYRRLGYFDAKVVGTIQYDESGKWVTITFTIEEGERYYVNEITVRGNMYHTSEELMKGLVLVGGEPFNQDKMEKDARQIKEIYGAQGFIFADIVPTPVYLPDQRLNLIYDITEGDVIRATDIRVHIAGDNSYTKERVALTMLGNLRPGVIISSREVENAERRLRFSQIFETNPQLGEPPRIDIQPTANDDNESR